MTPECLTRGEPTDIGKVHFRGPKEGGGGAVEVLVQSDQINVTYFKSM